jgi:hypothetical protein
MSRIENLLYNGIWIEKNYILLIGDEHKKFGFLGFLGRRAIVLRSKLRRIIIFIQDISNLIYLYLNLLNN